MGDGAQLANGRQMSAALGLTPKQHSSGGKDRLLEISKRGDSDLRTLLIHGARSVIRTAKHKEGRLSQWIKALAECRHPNVAAMPLADKTARIAWAMLRNGTDYEPVRVARREADLQTEGDLTRSSPRKSAPNRLQGADRQDKKPL